MQAAVPRTILKYSEQGWSALPASVNASGTNGCDTNVEVSLALANSAFMVWESLTSRELATKLRMS